MKRELEANFYSYWFLSGSYLLLPEPNSNFPMFSFDQDVNEADLLITNDYQLILYLTPIVVVSAIGLPP